MSYTTIKKLCILSNCSSLRSGTAKDQYFSGMQATSLLHLRGLNACTFSLWKPVSVSVVEASLLKLYQMFSLPKTILLLLNWTGPTACPRCLHLLYFNSIALHIISFITKCCQYYEFYVILLRTMAHMLCFFLYFANCCMKARAFKIVCCCENIVHCYRQ